MHWYRVELSCPRVSDLALSSPNGQAGRGGGQKTAEGVEFSVGLVNHNYCQLPHSEPLKDLVNCTVTEIMESCTQCH